MQGPGPTPELTPEPEPRRVGPAALVGGVKGVIAGFLVVVAWGGFVALMSGFRSWGSLTGSDVAIMALFVAGGALAGASLCGLDAAARRVGEWNLAFACRIAAGVVAPLAAASPFFGLGSRASGFLRPGTSLSGEVVGGFALAAVAFAVGQLAAGAPREPAHEAQGCWRLAKAGVVTPLAFLFGGTFVFGVPHELCSVTFGAAFLGLIAATLFWGGQKCATPVARRVAVWLEPDVLEAETIVDPARRLALTIAEAEQALAEAGRVRGPMGERLLREAHAALDRASASCPGYAYTQRRRILLRRAEAFLLAGDADRAEELATSVPFELALRAEVARQRGRLDVALRHAESWHDSRVDDASYTGRSARANALLLSALVRADEGRAEEARELVAEAEHATGSPETVFHHLTPERVRAYIQACTDRSRPA